eukprot:9743006-Alexandrium_andersonii.AAC.1
MDPVATHRHHPTEQFPLICPSGFRRPSIEAKSGTRPSRHRRSRPFAASEPASVRPGVGAQWDYFQAVPGKPH